VSGGYTLADARSLNGAAPAEEIAALVPGRVAKLIFQPAEGVQAKPERMWVEVTAVDGDNYTGTLANQPVFLPMNHGDPVTFTAAHVIDTAKGY
jgi:hypothetical protein